MAFDFDPRALPARLRLLKRAKNVQPPPASLELQTCRERNRKKVQGTWMGEFRFLKERTRLSRSSGFQTKFYVTN